MKEEDFLKEKQNIREKMLKYSRAISRGESLDEKLQDELSSDDILRRRKYKKRQSYNEEFGFFEKEENKSNIYLKEDLINVKLEEKESLALKILTSLKKTKKSKKNKKTKTQEQPIKIKELKEQNKDKNIQEKSLKENLEKKKQNVLEQETQKEKLDFEKQDLKFQESDEEKEKTKNTLLEGFSNATKEDKNLSFSQLLFAILFVCFALFLSVPQIYIRSQIYYLSREIASLRSQELVLSEENKDLQGKLENLRFQNQILDYLE